MSFVRSLYPRHFGKIAFNYCHPFFQGTSKCYNIGTFTTNILRPKPTSEDYQNCSPHCVPSPTAANFKGSKKWNKSYSYEIHFLGHWKLHFVSWEGGVCTNCTEYTCLICTDQVQLGNVLCAKAWRVADGLCRSSVAIMLWACIRALRTLTWR